MLPLGVAQCLPPGTRAVALPAWQAPRLVLSRGGWRFRWEASDFYPAFRTRARAFKAVIRLKALLGGFGGERNTLVASPVCDFVAGAIPSVARCAVLIPSRERGDRLVAKLWDREGRVTGYVKYARDGASGALLAHEHAVLSRIPGGLGPRVLRFGELGDGKAMLLEPLSGRTVAARLPPPPSAVKLAEALIVGEPLAIECHPIRSLWNERGGPAAWAGLLGNRKWGVAIQHGDFAPWNLVDDRDGVRAVDWESGCLEGFPYLDLAFFVLQVGALMYRWSPGRAAEFAARWLTAHLPISATATEARTMVQMAAYDSYSRDLGEGKTEGHPLQQWRRAVWSGTW